MRTDSLIRNYEVLSHAQRINLLNEKGKAIAKDSIPEHLMDYYWLWCITVGCVDNETQLDEIDKLSDECIVASTFVSSVESREDIKDEDRQELIDWIERHAVEKRYWETDGFSMMTWDFVNMYSFSMNICRRNLVSPFFIYSPTQLKDLCHLNELLIFIGIQLIFCTIYSLPDLMEKIRFGCTVSLRTSKIQTIDEILENDNNPDAPYHWENLHKLL